MNLHKKHWIMLALCAIALLSYQLYVPLVELIIGVNGLFPQA